MNAAVLLRPSLSCWLPNFSSSVDTQSKPWNSFSESSTGIMLFGLRSWNLPLYSRVKSTQITLTFSSLRYSLIKFLAKIDLPDPVIPNIAVWWDRAKSLLRITG